MKQINSEFKIFRVQLTDYARNRQDFSKNANRTWTKIERPMKNGK